MEVTWKQEDWANLPVLSLGSQSQRVRRIADRHTTLASCRPCALPYHIVKSGLSPVFLVAAGCALSRARARTRI